MSETNATQRAKTTTYPEHDKQKEVLTESQAIGEFLDYGLVKLGLVLCRPSEGGRHFYPDSRSIRDLLAEYFDIDQAKIEAEKREMLEIMRDLNADPRR